MLFDDCGKVIGSHYAGPTWESRRDGSKVTGVVLQRAPAPNSNAIPWLSLRGVPANPSGAFAPTTFIQRVNTTGGLAPAAAPTAPGEEARVAYTADDVFHRAKP